ncbi:YcjF family protein, partial [Oceanicola sp. S124]|uniref:YcjF family protein n=1 Tax=Oceanicola sp. S124 TaxID=1042378 RepID=UPI00025599B6
VTGLIATTPWLGWAVSALLAAFVLVLLAILLKEITAFARLSRIEHLHHALASARAAGDLSAARAATKQLTGLYRHRADMRWPLERFAERTPDQFDAEALIDLAEQELLSPLDRAARAEVEAAARQVATVTALVPLAFADVLTALTSNIRMIRRIADIYGGRSGTLGSLRLLRAVMTHLVATGAVAMGDDMLGSILGGNLLARLSRRFGEGVVNGALTARVGVAAMEVCRPMPFSDRRRPRVTAIIQSALTGLFARAEKTES